MAGTFVGGVTSALRGLSLAAGNADVRRTYAQLVAAIVALTLALDAAGVWAAFHFIPDGDTVGGSIGYWVLRIAAIAIVLLAAPIVSVFTANMAFPLLAERVFLAGVRSLDPRLADDLAARDGLPLSRSVLYSAMRLMVFLVLSVIAFAISLIPVIGPVIGPVLQALNTARSLGWELLDPWLDKHRLDYGEQRAYVAAHRGAILGFALPFGFVLAIPLLGPLLFGVAQAAVAVLATEVLDPPKTA